MIVDHGHWPIADFTDCVWAGFLVCVVVGCVIEEPSSQSIVVPFMLRLKSDAKADRL